MHMGAGNMGGNALCNVFSRQRRLCSGITPPYIPPPKKKVVHQEDYLVFRISPIYQASITLPRLIGGSVCLRLWRLHGCYTATADVLCCCWLPQSFIIRHCSAMLT